MSSLGLACAFEGRIGQDAELRFTANGLPMLSFSANVETAPAKGDKPAQSEWIKVVRFGDDAEALVTQCGRGDLVYVEGRLSVNRWQGQDGAERQQLNVVATLVQPMGRIGRRAPQRTTDRVYRSGMGATAGVSPRPGTPHYPQAQPPAAPPRVRLPDDQDDAPPW